MKKFKLFTITFWSLILFLLLLAYQEQQFSKMSLSDVNVETNALLNFDLKELSVTVENTSKGFVTEVYLEVLAGAQQVHKTLVGELSAGEKKAFSFNISDKVAAEQLPIITRMGYRSHGDQLGTVTLNEWRKNNTPNQISARCPDENQIINSRKVLNVDHPDNTSANLILPDGITLDSLTKTQNGSTFLLHNQHSLRNTNQTSFIVFEPQLSDSLTRTLVCPIKLRALGIPRKRSALAISPLEVFAVSILGLLISVITYRLSCRIEKLTPWAIAVIRWAFTIFIVASFYSFYAAAPQVSAILIWHLNGWNELLYSGGTTLVNWLVQAITFFDFKGINYEYFNTYCLHPLLLYILSLNLFTIRYLIKPAPFQDKYWHLFLKCAASFPTTQDFVCAESPAPNQADDSLAKTALLSLLVKVFFLPVFLSWTIGNLFHADYLLQNKSWNFFSINNFIVHLIISVDVLVFAVGYLVELPLVKNQIKSVESTLTGWLLCIICYPPINTWIFQGLDAPLTSSWSGVEEDTSKFFLILITGLWIIYAWATIALGFKASNLTNRGIVMSGPYRYVRHPAYISKLVLWTISGLFLAQFNFILVVTFWVVYWGRAVTEERHLSNDNDYLEYKAKVPWRFIPGIY